MYAGFWKRFFATLLDYTILFVIIRLFSTLLFVAIGFVSAFLKVPKFLEHGSLIDDESLRIVGAITLFGPLLLDWLYHTIMESSNCRGTVGKLAAGIVIVDENNKKISFGRANARYWSKIVSLVTILAGYIMVAFTAKKQALHDKIACSYVVNKKWLYYSECKKLNSQIPEVTVPPPAPGVNRLSVPLNKED
ncbi:RDD family protein [Paenibacillus ottowii]|uniref:RDD family protein n=1 Tax=Paenibacillus ottowii TaxID=2315729 RepID=A0ABY3B3F3_9BACL|nr:RDD family protein [Paenibacillus ottowii]NEU28901.1 RDD family protein [Paenibacillus polymyxa]TQR98291.1 RDD family protein [Paenibacillus ottowii]